MPDDDEEMEVEEPTKKTKKRKGDKTEEAPAKKAAKVEGIVLYEGFVCHHIKLRFKYCACVMRLWALGDENIWFQPLILTGTCTNKWLLWVVVFVQTGSLKKLMQL